ncbi:MAG: DUF3943 domain-containing protein [Gammaproteobacteria bacterium]|nr:DUF3943 domain-containing protein [Gammaproteobacteria bacterium]
MAFLLASLMALASSGMTAEAHGPWSKDVGPIKPATGDFAQAPEEGRQTAGAPDEGRQTAGAPDEGDASAHVAETPDWDGLTSDSAHLLGQQFAFVGFLHLLPESVTGWGEEETGGSATSRWRRNVGRVVWDEDHWFINYVGHPYFGAAYYVMARERQFDQTAAFWYSALASAMFEFGPEAINEEPSIQDLIVTPVAGALLGRYFHEVRTRIRTAAAGTRPRGRDRLVMFLTNPIGALIEGMTPGPTRGLQTSWGIVPSPPSASRQMRWRADTASPRDPLDGHTPGPPPTRMIGIRIRVDW